MHSRISFSVFCICSHTGSDVIDAATTRSRRRLLKMADSERAPSISYKWLDFFVYYCNVHEIYCDFQDFAFYHSYFRILPTHILVDHMTSKAVSRPIRITKHRRRTTNRSRDMLDFRILAFCQRWPLWVIRSSYRFIRFDPLSNIACKHHVAPTVRRYGRLKFWGSSYPFWPLGVIQGQRSRWIWKVHIWFPFSAQ